MRQIKKLLHLGIRSSRGNSAHVALVSGNLNGSLITPGCSPGVFHEPEVLASAVFGSIANGQNTMIKVLGAAVRLVINSCDENLKIPRRSIESVSLPSE